MPALTGNDLIQMTLSRLGGYANYPDGNTLLDYLNEAKDEIWGILKNTMSDYFDEQSQTADSSLENYFPKLTLGTRIYDLPDDFREIRWVSVNDAGYEDRRFVMKRLTDEEFRDAWNYGTEVVNQGGGAIGPEPNEEYLYAITGKGQFVMAQLPEFPFNLTLWYTRYILDFAPTDSVDQLMLPYSKKMADYAAKKVMLSAQDTNQFAVWKQQWMEDVISITNNASGRNQADAQFVQDFEG